MPPVFPQWLLQIPFLPRGSNLPAVPDEAGWESDTLVPAAEPGSGLGQALRGIFARAVTPSDVYVTLSITRAESTYTSTILLAGTGTDVAVTPAPVATTMPDAVIPIVTIFSTETIPSPTSIVEPISAAPTSTDPSSTTIVGAIVGAIVGSFLLIFFWWLFCVRGRMFGGGSSSSGSDRSRSSDSL